MNLTTMPMFSTGRKKIFCYESVITESNVQEIVEAAMPQFQQNVIEIEQLFQLYRGMDSTIVDRKREGSNEKINYRAFVSYYSLIADYAANLFMQNPLVYVNADGEDHVSESLLKYGKVQRAINTYARDKTTSFHTSICGVGYRFIEMDKKTLIKDSVLSPTSVMVLYGDDTDDNSMATVYITQVKDAENQMFADITQQKGVINFALKKHYTVYTDNFIYKWSDGDKDVDVSPAMPWGVPIVEYKTNPFYIGSFERVISLIHLLSILRSDGVNGVVQSIAGIIFGKNIGLPMPNETDDEDQKKFKAEIIEIFRNNLRDNRQMWVEDTKEKSASLDYVATELFNADIEVLYQGLINDIVTISSTPHSAINMGASGNAGAARTASGTDKALAHAKNGEPYWFESERNKTRISLDIAHYSGKFEELDVGDLDFAMQRAITDDPFTMSQAYSQLIAANVKPSDAARFTNIDADPTAWEKRQEEYGKELEERRLEYVRRETEITKGSKGIETIVVDES